MNVGTLKTLSYFASFALMGGIGTVAHDHVARGRFLRYFDLERAGEVLNSVRAPAVPVALALSYERDVTPAIVRFDWTGAPPPERIENPGPKPPPGPARVVPVQEILDVRAIFFHERNPGDSRALLRFADSPAATEAEYFLIGDTLPSPNEHVAVFDIRENTVVFSFADAERAKEQLSPPSLGGCEWIHHVEDPSQILRRRGLGRGMPRARNDQELAAPATTELRNGQYYIGTEDAAAFAQGYAQILRDVGTETYYDAEGRRAGIRITSVEAGSIAARHGAQQGDVIVSINGKPVHSEQEALAFAKKNSDQYDVWRVEIMNLGRVRTEIFHSPGD